MITKSKNEKPLYVAEIVGSSSKEVLTLLLLEPMKATLGFKTTLVRANESYSWVQNHHDFLVKRIRKRYRCLDNPMAVEKSPTSRTQVPAVREINW